MKPLRPRQAAVRPAIAQAYNEGHRRIIVQAPTGFGKTLTAAHMIDKSLSKGKRVAFTVPRISLVDQTVERFGDEGLVNVGVMQGTHPLTDFSQPVQVCSVSTLIRRRKPEVAIVHVDEAHMMFKGMMDWMSDPAWKEVLFVGWSATPWTRGLGKFYTKLIVAATTKDLIKEGWLSPYKAFAPSIPDLQRIHTLGGDFNQEELAERMDTKSIIGDIVETWLRQGEFRPTFCFCVNRRHAMHICEQFNEAGVVAEYMDAFTEREDRTKVLRRYRAGVTKVICNVGVLTTGVDEDVRCIIDAHPTKSEMLWVQSIGRGLRTAEGKDHLLILDHAGNHIRHGTVDGIHHDELDDGKPKPPREASEKVKDGQEPKAMICEQCKAVMPPDLTQCPSCGHLVRRITATVHDGMLVELGKRQLPPPVTTAKKQRFFQELKSLRGTKKIGWVTAKFKEKFDYFPPRSWVGLDPLPATLETKRWVQSRAIAWAAMQKKTQLQGNNANRTFFAQTS